MATPTPDSSHRPWAASARVIPAGALALAATAIGPAAAQSGAAPGEGMAIPEVVEGQSVSPVTGGQQLELSFYGVPAVLGPWPGRVEALRRPEFIRRDLPLLIEGLGFDEAQATIAETLLDEYGEAFALAVGPLEDALDRYRSQRHDRALASMLVEAQAEGGFLELAGANAVVVGGTEGQGVFMIRQDYSPDGGSGGGGSGGSGGGGGSGGSADAGGAVPGGGEAAPARRVVARALSVIVSEESQEGASEGTGDAASLLERVRSRLEAAERAGEIVTADELVRLARRLRAERELLRTEFLELLQLIVEGDDPEATEQRLADVLDRILIERELSHGRLGGEALDLHAALAATAAEVDPDAGTDAARTSLAAAWQDLDAARTNLAAALRERAAATGDREVAGLEVFVARERREAGIRTALEQGSPMPTADGPSPEVRRFVGAARRELDASVAVRDDRLARLKAIETILAEASPAMVSRLREQAMARAFPGEVRPRWAERALRHAESLPGLDPAVAAALAGIRTEHDIAAQEVREQRIATRIADEPARVRERIDAMLETEAGRSMAFMGDGGIDAATDPQVALDRSIRQRLDAILTPEQRGTLPPRRRVIRLGEGNFSFEVGTPKDD